MYGEAYGVTNPLVRDALLLAVDLWIDEGYDEVARLSHGDEGIGVFDDYLPPMFEDQYGAVFYRAFMNAIVVVSWKLAQPKAHSLACVAEELALNAIVQKAKVVVDMWADDDRNPHVTLDNKEALDSGLEDVIEDMAEDRDFEYLFHGRTPEGPVADSLGLTVIAFHLWFEPFNDDGSRGFPHPYVPSKQASR